MIFIKNTCIIFAAGDFNGSFSKNTGDYLIAADAGYHHLKRLNIIPDMVIGDFDTIGELPVHDNVITFPKDKDYTDTELAVIEGQKLGYKDFVIYGALGGKRLEHTIANISLATSYAEKGCSIILTDGTTYLSAIYNSCIKFNEKQKGFVSVFPFNGKACGVDISGLKYALNNATLDSTNPTLGVSNEFTGVKSNVSVKDGTLIIIWQKCEN